jgi:hypothetical protein
VHDAVRIVRLHELRQERDEEDGQLGIEDVDRDRGDDDLERRAGAAGVLVDVQRAAVAQRPPREIQEVGDGRGRRSPR